MNKHPGRVTAVTTTRRTVVKTGAKLAYAAPLVAVSLKARGAFAAQGPNGEFDCDCLPDEHSYHPDTSTGTCVSCNNNVTGCPGGSQPVFGETITCRRGNGAVLNPSQECAPRVVAACAGGIS